jgi:hypothetical protein
MRSPAEPPVEAEPDPDDPEEAEPVEAAPEVIAPAPGPLAPLEPPPAPVPVEPPPPPAQVELPPAPVPVESAPVVPALEAERESVAGRLRALRDRSARPRPPVPPAEGRIGLGERVTSVGYSARGVLSDARHSTSERWHAIPLIARQRVGAAAIVVAVVAIVALVLVPAAPCSFPGGDACAPGDDAIDLVPADALAYAHVDIDPESDQYAAARALAARLPLLTGIATGPISTVGGSRIDFATDVEPWAGGEAALVMLPGATRPESVTLIEADDPDRAEAFASSLLGPTASTTDVGGVAVSVGDGNLASALLDGFLVLGDRDAVSRIIDPPDDAGKLETSAASAAIDDLPDDRVAYAYLSGAGARAVLATPALQPLDTFVDSAGTAGVAAALSVDGDVISVTTRSRLDPARAEGAPGFFSALPGFDPTLDADVGPDALAYLGFGEPASSVRSLLSQASTEAPALHRAYQQAATALRKDGGVSITKDLLPLLGSEVAVSVEPVAAASSGTPGVAATPGVPYVSLLANGVDSAKAATDLAKLQKPLADALVPKSGEVAGRVSVFEPLQIAGIDAQSLTVSPNVELTYATYDDRLAVATDPLGIAQARAGGDGLSDSDTFRQVTSGLPGQVSLIAYLDLRDLIALGEQIGLAADPGYATLAPDLRALDAAALAVSDDGGVIRTDLRLAVGEAPGAQVDAPALPGE